MSTWTGGTNGGPESLSDSRCNWTFCSLRVPNRFAEQNLRLCREHALLVWAIVDEQMKDGTHPSFLDPQPDDEVKETPRELPPQPGHVYYIRTGGRIKIGHTTRLWSRLAQYPPDIEVLYVQQGDRKLERQEHHRFRAYLADGREWFQDRPEVAETIKAMAATQQWEGILENSFWRRRRTRTEPHVDTRRQQ